MLWSQCHLLASDNINCLYLEFFSCSDSAVHGGEVLGSREVHLALCRCSFILFVAQFWMWTFCILFSLINCFDFWCCWYCPRKSNPQWQGLLIASPKILMGFASESGLFWLRFYLWKEIRAQTDIKIVEGWGRIPISCAPA